MPNGTADERSEQDGLSRRHLFKQLGVAGVAAAAWKVPLSANAAVAADAPAPAAAATPEALETLTAAEADILEAIVARLIPTDENGAGATEARAAHYIDRALAGPLAGSRATYAAGLAALTPIRNPPRALLSPPFPQRTRTTSSVTWRKTPYPALCRIPRRSSNWLGCIRSRGRSAIPSMAETPISSVGT